MSFLRRVAILATAVILPVGGLLVSAGAAQADTPPTHCTNAEGSTFGGANDLTFSGCGALEPADDGFYLFEVDNLYIIEDGMYYNDSVSCMGLTVQSSGHYAGQYCSWIVN